MTSASGDPNFSGRRPPALGLLQFTSGSTGTPRGVALGLDHVEANVRAIEAWLEMDSNSSTATWLPFSHDMGLIGTLLTPVATQTMLSVIPPEQFVVKPIRWLECFGKDGANNAACPTFGLGLTARKVKPEDLEGFDFSGWRVLIVGAERVRVKTLEAFSQLLAPRGFSRRAFRPAYGLAEVTLAATGHGGGDVASMVKVDWTTLRDAEPVRVTERRTLGPVDPDDASDWLVGCGRPLAGVEVEVVEPDATTVLPEGHLGEIVVGGRSLAGAYWTADSRDRTPFADRRFATGDIGFLLDGELYVVGRIGDRLKVRARYVYAEDIEARLVAGSSLRIGRLAVLLGALKGVDSAVLIVEDERDDWSEEVLRVLRQATGEELQIYLLKAPRGTIERTTSGKPRRRVMWAKLEDGLLSTTLVRDWSPR
jgi:acyl-CoA synthetase (AMP-forming)/AMP-acid ligase II